LHQQDGWHAYCFVSVIATNPRDDTMFKKLLTATLFTLAASSAQADLYNIDAFTDGDLKGAYVDTLDVAWLDLSLNFNATFEEALSAYPDYRVPTDAEVEELFNNAFPTLAGAPFFNLYGDETSSDLTVALRHDMLHWADTLGFNINSTSNQSYGRYYDEDSEIRQLGLRNQNQNFTSWYIAGTEFDNSVNDNNNPGQSIFLVKDLDSAEVFSARSQSGLAVANVPFAGLGALSLLALAGLRRQRQA
jgi:opacity protein-like surface antigen